MNIVPWLSLVPCTFLAKSISERLIKSGFGITATRKIVESICLITESIGLLVLGNFGTVIQIIKSVIVNCSTIFIRLQLPCLRSKALYSV